MKTMIILLTIISILSVVVGVLRILNSEQLYPKYLKVEHNILRILSLLSGILVLVELMISNAITVYLIMYLILTIFWIAMSINFKDKHFKES